MGNGHLIDIILFAAIAAFLILRLRSVLGRRTGYEGKSELDPFRQREANGEESADEKVVHLPDNRAEPTPGDAAAAASTPQGPAAAGLTKIKLADQSFDDVGFLQGARGAFEMIIAAFADGDSKALRPLLADEVYRDFTSAIDSRKREDQSLQTTLVGISEAEILEAELQGKVAFVTVKFVSEQVNVTRDNEDRIVDGDPNEVVTVTDIWTFARNLRSRDPNWTLVATSSPN